MDPNDYEPVPPRQRKKPKVKESIIDHTYRDYSQVEVSSDDEPPSTADIDKKSSRLQPNFPAKLHAIVSNPNYQHIICWQPHGRSWKIVDKHLLSTVICPKHFAHAKFESFNRSVNGWGFKVCMGLFYWLKVHPMIIVFASTHLNILLLIIYHVYLQRLLNPGPVSDNLV